MGLLYLYLLLSDDYFSFMFGLRDLLLNVIIQVLVPFEIGLLVSILLRPINHINTHYSSGHNTLLFLSVLHVLIVKVICSVACTCRICATQQEFRLNW